jgi:hypothetical protein
VEMLDPISGNAWVNGIGVEVTPVEPVAVGAATHRRDAGRPELTR